MEHSNFGVRLDALENGLEELQVNAAGRLDRLEAEQSELASAILDYVRADMATPWMDSAKRLQATLLRLIRDRE